MKTLVTGGMGFVGSHTVVELQNEGHEVVIVDDLSNAKESVLGRIMRITGTEPTLHVFDIRDEKRLDELMAGERFDSIMHFAGLKAVGESVEKPLTYYRVNVGGSAALFQVAQRNDVRTIVFSSSSTVYGDPDRVPVTEADPLKTPANPYGKTKLVIEEMLRDLHASEEAWKIGLLRYFNPVGAHPSGLIGEDPTGIPNNLMPYLTQVASGKLDELRVFGSDYDTPDGTGIRDYVHVVDLARGHVAALDYMQTHAGCHAWNLGTGRGTSVLELVAAFEEATGERITRRLVGRRAGDIAANWADVSKAEQQLGWRADADVRQMCEDSWRWQQFSDANL